MAHTIACAAVIAPPRKRPLDAARVESLAESIELVGLLNPIVITSAHVLVAGAHRLAAYRRLGRADIPAHVVDLDTLRAELAEIDENLIRNELTALERAEHLARRKEIYEALYPETRPVTERGGPGRGKKTTAESAAVSTPSFVAATAAATGAGERTIREDVQVASIPEALRDRIRGTRVEDQKTALLEIAQIKDAAVQNAVVPLVVAHETLPVKVAARIARACTTSDGAFDAAKAETMAAQLDTGARADSDGDSWGTPPEWIEIARSVMGSVDLDPASNAHAQKTVRAARFYTKEQDGLAQLWFGNVWLNPPYSQPHVAQFAERVVAARRSGEIAQACVLVNNATDTAFAQTLLSACSAVLFPRGRITFHFPGAGAELTGTRQGQMLVYFGANVDRFAEICSALGWVGVSAYE